VMPVGDRDHIGCFTDQVKLTRALVRDLNEAVKEVNLLGEHEEESSQKITELEALSKRLREDTHNEDEDDDDGGNAIAPPTLAPAAVPEEIVEEEDPVENGPHELDDLDDLGDLDEDPNEGPSEVDEWFPQDGSIDRD
jgi:hypothetical protein